VTLAAELLNAARQAGLMEADRDRLAARVALLERREAEAVRAAYRRGYHAGYGARANGKLRVTNPERHARTWVREALQR
jgi:hypothetical protein